MRDHHFSQKHSKLVCRASQNSELVKVTYGNGGVPVGTTSFGAIVLTHIFCTGPCTMGKDKRGRKATGKDKARKPNTRRKNAGSKSSAPPKARKKEVYTKLAIRSRAKRCVEKQAHMEAARVECVRLGIGATKYLRHEKWGQQLPGCPLTWSDKSRLAANIKSGHTPRNGVHNMHLTPAEEADFAASIMPAAHRKQPFTWTEISEAVADTLDKRNLGPAGRLVPAVGLKVAQCVMNGRASWKWRSAFCGRTGVKDFNPEDLGHSRARASNEHAKYEHMRDLQEELVDSGVMASNDDPRILHTRRVANLDEVPQVMNARVNAGNAKERVAGIGGRLILIISLSLIISRALCAYLPPSLISHAPVTDRRRPYGTGFPAGGGRPRNQHRRDLLRSGGIPLRGAHSSGKEDTRHKCHRRGSSQVNVRLR